MNCTNIQGSNILMIDAITNLAIFISRLTQAANTICEQTGYDPTKVINPECQVPFYRE